MEAGGDERASPREGNEMSAPTKPLRSKASSLQRGRIAAPADVAVRPERLPDGAPLEYAPENEQGVVYLFSTLARKRYGLRVERVQAGYPDCLATKHGKPVRIEFEFRSRNFALHRHDPAGCDWIVCWIHDWPACPAHFRVVELRRDYGLGFNVWFQPVSGPYADKLGRSDSFSQWSVASQASEGDLILFYRTAPDSFVRDVFRVSGPVKRIEAPWKAGLDWMASIERVCTLKAPLRLEDLRRDPGVRDAGFVRGAMRGRPRATAYWPEVHRMIVERNPGLPRALRRFGPERVACQVFESAGASGPRQRQAVPAGHPKPLT